MKNKESDTLSQQRKARAEFLELKKMQSGEIEPKDEHIEAVPDTLEKKAENIMYHYGKFIIVGLIISAIIITSVIQCAKRVKPDISVVLFTYTSVEDARVKNIEKYFSKYCTDVNGDGKITVKVYNCSVNTNNSADNAKFTKLQSIITSEPTALLFITDSKSIKYFDNIKIKESSFFSKTVYLGKDFAKECGLRTYNTTLGDLSVSLRKISGTTIEKDKKTKKCYDTSKQIINKLN